MVNTTTERTLEMTPFGAKEPYDVAAATVQLTMTLHPEDGHPKGRLVTLAAWTHGDAPIVRACRREELGDGWPPAVAELLEALRAELPAREQLAKERQRIEAEKAAKDAADEVKRKEQAGARLAKSKAPLKQAPTPSVPPAPTLPPSDPTPQPPPPKCDGALSQGSLFETPPEASEEEKEESEEVSNGKDPL